MLFRKFIVVISGVDKNPRNRGFFFDNDTLMANAQLRKALCKRPYVGLKAIDETNGLSRPFCLAFNGPGYQPCHERKKYIAGFGIV